MPTRLPIATFVNMATVTVGSLIGMSLQQVFPENIQAIIFQAIGLGTLLIGILMSLKLPDGYLLVLIFSLILGGVTGELIGLDAVLAQMGESIKSSLNLGDPLFTEGLVTAFLLFCVGSMTIVGAIEEGLQGKRELLYVKSMLDGVASIAFASTYGIGVLFSIFPMLLFQGGMTVLAVWIKPIFTDLMLNMLNAVGGILILGIGINLLKMADINLENLLPSLVFVLLLTPLYKWVRARS
jgi:uncharacterized membrane protein YqgA involved in biofilm formation